MCQYSTRTIASDWHFCISQPRVVRWIVLTEATAVLPRPNYPQRLRHLKDDQLSRWPESCGLFMIKQRAGMQLAHAGRKAALTRVAGHERSESNGGWNNVVAQAHRLSPIAIRAERSRRRY